MEHKFTVASIHDPEYRSPKRRKVIVEVQKHFVPESRREIPSTETFTVQYHAYGHEHFCAAVERYGGTTINFNDAKKISAAIREIIIP